VHGGKGGAGSPSGGIQDCRILQAYVTDTWDRAVVFIAAAFFAAAMLVGGLVVVRHLALRPLPTDRPRLVPFMYFTTPS
jgi:hypothetical protein